MSAEAFSFVDLDKTRFRDPLTPADAARGMLATHRNMRRLFDDALLLLENARYPSATTTALLAHEEAPKAMAIVMILTWLPPPSVLDKDKAKQLRRLLWAPFNDHAEKNRQALDLHRRLGDWPAELRESVASMNTQELAEDFVELRERGTYTECVQGRERWSIPEMVVDRATAALFVSLARRTFGRLLVPNTTLRTLAANQMVTRLIGDRRAGEIQRWADSAEAQRLSDADCAEHERWLKRADAGLEPFKDDLESE